jgi:hypothetical protein
LTHIQDAGQEASEERLNLGQCQSLVLQPALCHSILRACTGWEISQSRKTWGLKSESFGQETVKTREEQALSMVDRAGFEPAAFRTLGLEFAKRTIFGPRGIPD